MNGKQVVLGIFENEMYAIIAKRDLRAIGIKANILKNGKTLTLLNQTKGVQLMIPDSKIEQAKKLLKTKFN